MYILNKEDKSNFSLHRAKDEILGELLRIMELQNPKLSLTDCWGWILNVYCCLHTSTFFSLFSKQHVSNRTCTLNEISILLDFFFNFVWFHIFSGTSITFILLPMPLHEHTAFQLFPWTTSDILTWQSTDSLSVFSMLISLSTALLMSPIYLWLVPY